MERPNIVLITVDCLRYDYFSKELMAKKTRIPFLRKLARRGILFENFYANGSWSGTAMPSILTSTYPFDNGGRCELFGREPSLTQVLKEEGYLTFGIHANPYFLSSFGYNRGLDYFYDWFTSSNEKIYKIKFGLKDTIRKLPHINNIIFKTMYRVLHKIILPIFEKIYPTINIPYPKAEKINTIAFSCFNYYKKRLRNNPFFLWLHYMDLHAPLFPDKKYWGKGLNFKDIKGLHNKLVKYEGVNLTQKEHYTLQNLYLASLSQVNNEIKNIHDFIINEMDKKNTVFIITADHGELLAEKKNFYSHGIWLYQELIHIPLLIIGKDSQPSRDFRLLSQIDLPPTVLRIAGIEPPSIWRGKEFLDKNLTIKGPGKRVIFAEEGRIRREDQVKMRGDKISFAIDWEKRSFAVIADKYKYIKNYYLKTEEFYDLSKDKMENNNLINSKNLQEKIAFLKRNLEAHIKIYHNYE